ncbi:MAG: class B sortase [Angelakisella sp.]
MKMTKTTTARRVLSLLLVTMMVLTLAACGDKPSSKPSSDAIIENSSSIPSESSSSESSSSESSSESSSSSSSSSTSSSSSSVPKDTRSPADIQKDLLSKMVAVHKQNDDTVGWLYVPGTTINEATVQTVDNEYYLRRNYLTKQDFNGCYYVDFRANMGNRTNLSKNAVIYGHSMDDNPDGTKFSQMKKYLNKDFAQENQFIYFSTPESDMVWQVFAVFYTDVSLNYNNPNPETAEYQNLINDVRKRSLHNFDVPVTAKDNILTLSTCTYVYDKNYPNNYRYVVMAKLLDKGAAQTPAKVETNPSPKAPK